MKTVMNQSHDGWLLKMISRTDPVILQIPVLAKVIRKLDNVWAYVLASPSQY